MQDETSSQHIEYIRSKAKIYGKDPAKKITSYQAAVNEAAETLCIKDPNLLLNRQKMLERAREEVNIGYKFKKGKSRSRNSLDPSPPKRVKTTEDTRKKHICDLQEDLKDLNDQLTFKEKRRDQALAVRNYQGCDRLTEEMSSIKKKKKGT